MKNIYFPGLNGVRFFAAFLVIIDHIELFKINFGYESFWSEKYSSFLGSSGVTIFFVLSGFLITYLLLNEQLETEININKFYFRRILRIWPLYFLIILIAFFVIPKIEIFATPNYVSNLECFSKNLALYLCLMANVAFVYMPSIAFASILWSVAVEEQFYLFWPHVVKKSKKLFKTIIFLIVLYLILKFFTRTFFPESRINYLIDRTRFTTMLIGALGALLLFNKHRLLSFIYKSSVQIVALFSLLLFMLNLISNKYFHAIESEVLSCIIIILILNIASNVNSIIQLENKLLNYLGKISYGLYVYHLFAVVLVLNFLPTMMGFNNLNKPGEYFILLFSILILTIFISHISYTLIEKPILKLKSKFSTIISGDQVIHEK